MQILTFKTTAEKTALLGLLDGLGSTAEQRDLFRQRMASERAEAEAARGMSHEDRQWAALADLDAAWGAARTNR